jgi:hypothetical protein
VAAGQLDPLEGGPGLTQDRDAVVGQDRAELAAQARLVVDEQHPGTLASH